MRKWNLRINGSGYMAKPGAIEGNYDHVLRSVEETADEATPPISVENSILHDLVVE